MRVDLSFGAFLRLLDNCGDYVSCVSCRFSSNPFIQRERRPQRQPRALQTPQFLPSSFKERKSRVSPAALRYFPRNGQKILRKSFPGAVRLNKKTFENLWYFGKSLKINSCCIHERKERKSHQKEMLLLCFLFPVSSSFSTGSVYFYLYSFFARYIQFPSTSMAIQLRNYRYLLYRYCVGDIGGKNLGEKI